MSKPTIEQIRDQPAGHEINGLVAEHVMGWTRPTGEHEGPWNPLWESDRISGPGHTLAYYHNAKTGVLLTPEEHRRMTMWNGPIGQRELNPPLYSAEIHRAWEVVEKMKSEHDRLLYLERFDSVQGSSGWAASFRWSGLRIWGSSMMELAIYADVASLAICRAAVEWAVNPGKARHEQTHG